MDDCFEVIEVSSLKLEIWALDSILSHFKYHSCSNVLFKLLFGEYSILKSSLVAFVLHIYKMSFLYGFEV